MLHRRMTANLRPRRFDRGGRNDRYRRDLPLCPGIGEGPLSTEAV
jgi:hypothetical protein